MAFESDPDYDDFEFREIYPKIYGDDEPIEVSRPSQNRRVQNLPMEWTKNDEQFHQEYLKWKRDHPNRVEEIKGKTKSQRMTPIAPVRINHLISFTLSLLCFSTPHLFSCSSNRVMIEL